MRGEVQPSAGTLHRCVWSFYGRIFWGRDTGNTTPSPTTGSASAATIKTATLSVGGKSMTVLTNAQGMTLYYRTSDTPSSVCSGGCASAWPPLLSSSMPSVFGGAAGHVQPAERRQRQPARL